MLRSHTVYKETNSSEVSEVTNYVQHPVLLYAAAAAVNMFLICFIESNCYGSSEYVFIFSIN